MTKAHDYAKAHHEVFTERFLELIKNKSISTDPAFKDDVHQTAEWIANHMSIIGLDAELITMTAGRHPIVLGQWHGAGEDAKTVIIYCHYDVQPAVIADGWDSDPFDPCYQRREDFRTRCNR